VHLLALLVFIRSLEAGVVIFKGSHWRVWDPSTAGAEGNIPYPDYCTLLQISSVGFRNCDLLLSTPLAVAAPLTAPQHLNRLFCRSRFSCWALDKDVQGRKALSSLWTARADLYFDSEAGTIRSLAEQANRGRSLLPFKLFSAFLQWSKPVRLLYSFDSYSCLDEVQLVQYS